VTNAEAVTTAVNAVVMLWGGVDILVAFAGVVKCEDALDMSQAAWKRVLDVNLTGSFICAQAVAKYDLWSAVDVELVLSYKTDLTDRAMEAGGRGGSIVLTASISGHAANFPQPQVNYNVSTAGVLMMVKSLAAEWGRYGIRVNSISPGYMNTVLNEGDGLNDHRKIWIERTPLGRIGGVDELNGAVILLCSDAGKFITGTDIKVDGMYWMVLSFFLPVSY
jgi:sorbose reductase